MACEEPLYTIREVSELTGVKPVTLRAWQRRYNLVQPQRTEKGHRLYLSSDIATIRQTAFSRHVFLYITNVVILY